MAKICTAMMKGWTSARWLSFDSPRSSHHTTISAPGMAVRLPSAPAATENAKPENPLTKPPRKTAVESIASSTGACIRVPQEARELAVDAGRQPDLSSTRPLRCRVECVHEACRHGELPRGERYACAIANQGPAPEARECS